MKQGVILKQISMIKKLKIRQEFYETSMKDNILIDFYDGKSKQQSSETSLFYIDLVRWVIYTKIWDFSRLLAVSLPINR